MGARHHDRAGAEARPLRLVPNRDAVRLLGEAFVGGKNASGTAAAPRLTACEEAYVLAEVPLRSVRPNEAGWRYDETVDPRRALAYARLGIDTPVSLRFGAWAAGQGSTTASVMDGGHRTTAARLRGERTLRALMRRSDYLRLFGPAALERLECPKADASA